MEVQEFPLQLAAAVWGITKKMGGGEFHSASAVPANLRSGCAAEWVFGCRVHAWIPASESISQIAIHHLCADLQK